MERVIRGLGIGESLAARYRWKGKIRKVKLQGAHMRQLSGLLLEKGADVRRRVQQCTAGGFIDGA
jgi:hypothetical protein